ncbi:hypothetical protein [Microbacterium luticocti]|uniref:hypothetical protein n=1 Tax=Microbacterium luticocti TaxID=451764 RepID=UPI0004031CB3|nr:hypothetical protein [Microbacterium luticocti]
MPDDDDDKYWYNLATGQVERGMQSPAVDRAGPFDSAEEAARAPEIMRERTRQWEEDERRENDWGTSAGESDDR